MANKEISNAPAPIKPISTGGYFHKPKPPTIPPADYETWCKADLWSIERGILLLLGAEHIPYGEYGEREFYKAYQDDFNKIWAIAESSLKTGVLKKIGKGYPTEVLPGDFIAWAMIKGYSIPAELEPIDSMKQVETMGVDEEGKKTNTKSTINAQRNEIAKEWLSTKKTEEIEDMTTYQILEELKLFSPNNKGLFTSGGDGWLSRDHSVISRRMPGRKKSR